MAEYDRSSKWLIQHHGDAILRLAGVRGVRSWRALQAELVQPGQLPDGLLEVQIEGRSRSDLYVVEIATYPERRLERQLLRDALLVYLDRDVMPEVLALVLHPKGRLNAASEVRRASTSGKTHLRVGWQVIELWRLDGAELLATQDPGVMPWVPLTRIPGSPEEALRVCRRVIDRVPAADERANLLAVTQVLAALRYNDPQLLEVLGGQQIMIESPVLRELEARGIARGKAEGKAEAILHVLRNRFRTVPEEVETSVLAIRDEERLDSLLDDAITCGAVAEFRRRLQ